MKNKTRINLGTQSHAFCRDTLDEAREKLLENGFKYIQVSPPKISKEICQDISFDVDKTANYMKEKLKGLNIVAIGCYVNLCDESGEATEKFLKYIELTSKLGIKYICTETGKRDALEETHSEENYQRVKRNLKIISAYTQRKGVTVCIEMAYPHSIWNVDVLRRLLSEVDCPNIGCLFDPAGLMDKSNIDNQKEIFDTYFDYFKDKIKFMHIKDVTFRDGTKKVTIPGKGDMDFDYLFKKIYENFETIDIIIDSPNEAFVLETREAVKKYIQEVK